MCSVALHQDTQLLAATELHRQQSHSSQLTLMIEGLLLHNDYTLQDLAAVAVSKGPGSYTGLRIGVATAKGLAFGLDIPLVAVDTLQAMAEQIFIQNPQAPYACPMIDARRMEVYCALYAKDHTVVSPTQALILEPDTFDEYLAQAPIYFGGNGAAKFAPLKTAQPNAVFLPQLYPNAAAMGTLAAAAYQDQQWEDLAYFEPYYLKDFMVKPPTKAKL